MGDDDVTLVLETLFDIRAAVYEIREEIVDREEDDDGPGEEEEE